MQGFFMQLITTDFETLFQAITELENQNFIENEEYFQKEHIEIETPDGYSKILGMITKIANCQKIVLDDNKYLEAAAAHILFDVNNNEIYLESLEIGNSIQTKDGLRQIITKENTSQKIVYDVQVDNESHTYYDANGIKHHNSLLTSALSRVYNDMDYNAITIVPSTDLVNQTFEWYERCGLDVGKYCGSDKDYKHKSVVSTWQSLQNNPRILQTFQTIIWDEAHGVKGQVARDLLTEHAKHAPFKYGVTGTFPKSYTDQLCLKASIGEIVTTMTARWLMDNEYLTPVEIETFKLKEKEKQDFPDYSAERSYLTKNKDRLEVLADLIIHKCEQYGNTLVLVSSVQFGEKLASLIDGAVFLYGATDTATRKENYDLFETDDGIIRIATYGIASTGISIDRMMCLMMIDAGKSYIRAIQSIGRCLRQAEGKFIAHVCDVYSSLKWSTKHFKERKKYYIESEYPITGEFDVKI
jgi:hypothetical protein